MVTKGASGGSGALGDLTIPVSRLHLSLTNPRHEAVGSEADAIAHLCDEELIEELARDIASRGALSPLEVLGVIEMPGNKGHFIALEGNRRTCALILLADPERAPKKFQASLKRIATKANAPKNVKVHVFADAAEAKQWIELRHLGQQGGAGMKSWDTDQKTRAAGGVTKASARANDLALAVLDRLEKRGLITKQQRKQVSLSTVTRYVGTPGVRAILGLGSASELLYTHSHDDVDRGLQRLVLDSIEPGADGKYPVHSRSDSNDRQTYAHDLKSQGYTPTGSATAPTPPPKPTKVVAPRGSGRRSANSINSRRLLDRSFVVPPSVKDAVLISLRDEALNLPLEEFRFSGNYLLRALVERILILFAKKKHRLQSKMSDDDLLRACHEELEKSSAPTAVLNTLNQARNKSQGHSLHSLGHAVHGGAIVPARDTKARFHTWEPVLVEILGKL
jgi:hypothetical protein